MYEPFNLLFSLYTDMVMSLPGEQDLGREEFGRWLRSKREERKLSRAELSRLADISDMQIYRIEQGETGSKRETLRLLANALQIDENEVLRRAGFYSRLPVEDEEAGNFQTDWAKTEDDPLLIIWETLFHAVPPENRSPLIGKVAKIVREHQLRDTPIRTGREGHGRTEAETDARIVELKQSMADSIVEIQCQVEAMQREIARLREETFEDDAKENHADGSRSTS